MTVIEISDKSRITAMLSDDPLETLEALDENILGVEGIVTVFAPDEQRPPNMMVVRWGQKALGLGSLALLRASRFTGLAEVVEALPVERGELDLKLPFWASPAVSSSLRAEPVGAEAVYAVDRESLHSSKVAPRCERLDDVRVVKPMFPKLAEGAPVYVLAFGDALVSVAAVTHLRAGVARASVYTVEEHRGRGFGGGVLTALAEDLLTHGVVPTASADLAREPVVRMLESAGFRQRGAHLRAKVTGRASRGTVRIG